MDIEFAVGNKRLQLREGDIVRQSDIAAVVNAANAELMPGGGVAGAIHRAAGPGLADECRPLAPISPGEAVITPGHDLPNTHVIHCLGPVHGRDEPSAELLASCYRRALEIAEQQGLASVAFPAISTGAFGYPMEDGARVAMEVFADQLPRLENVCLVRMVLPAGKAMDAFRRAAEAHGLAPPAG